MQDLFAALALMLVLEGILPFVNPRGWRDAIATLAELDSRSIRIAGAVSIGCGLALLHFVRG